MKLINIFVARLNYKTTSDELYELFTAFGDVKKAKIIIDAHTGISKGYGFVLMSDEKEALYAIEQLHNSTFNKRKIIVKIAQEMNKTNQSKENTILS